MENKQRITWIDMAKGYGIIAVFVGHLVEGSPVGDFVYAFHLPLFFFLSGCVFRGDMSFPDFLKKKLRSILLPYVTLGLLIPVFDTVYVALFNRMQLLQARVNAWEWLLGKYVEYVCQIRYATLWYLAALFFVNLVTFGIVKIKKPMGQLFLVLLIVAAGIVYHCVCYGPFLPWNVDVVPMALPFFFIGYYVKKDGVAELVYSKIPTWLLLCLSILLYVATGLLDIWNHILTGEGLEMFWSQYGNPAITFLAAFCGIIATCFLAKVWTLRPLRYIGEHSLLFFLWHQALVYPLLQRLYEQLHWDNIGSPVASYLWVLCSKTLLTCVVMFLLCELLRRILPKPIGKIL